MKIFFNNFLLIIICNYYFNFSNFMQNRLKILIINFLLKYLNQLIYLKKISLSN